MKKLVIVLLLLSNIAAAYQFPSSSGYVNDFAGVIDGESESYISTLASSIAPAELAVVTMATINESGMDVNEYAVKLFESWGIGKKEKDNGMLVLLVVDQRRIKVEVGYGLEGVLPDGRVGRILDNNIEYFRNSSYSEGLKAVANDIAAAIKSEPASPEIAAEINYAVIAVSIIFFAVFIAAVYFAARTPKCPVCKVKMVQKDWETYVCPKCRRKKKKRVFLLAGGLGAGGGWRGSGGGGFGGGAGGGGGAGRGF